jgi:acyl dehydratase
MGYAMRGLHFDDFDEGRQFFSASRTVTEADVVNFAGLSGDFNPLHTDETFAQQTPVRTRIAHGMLSMAIATGLANQMGIFEGTTLALMQQTIHYKGMVRFGDTIRLVMTVSSRKESKNPKRGVVTFQVDVLNQKDETIIGSEWTLMMARRAEAAEAAEE